MKKIIKKIKFEFLKRKIEVNGELFVLRNTYNKEFFQIYPDLSYKPTESISEIKKRENQYINAIKKGETKFYAMRGNKEADILPEGINLLLSEKFIRFLKKNNSTGLKYYPISIKDYKTKRKISKYFFIEPSKFLLKTDWSKNIDNNYLFVGSLDYENLFISFIFNFNNKEDIFGIKDTKYILVTKRLKELIEKAKLTNIKFENVYKLKVEK